MAEPVIDLTVVLGEKLKAMGTSAHVITRMAIQKGLRAAAAVVLSRTRHIIYGGHPEHLNKPGNRPAGRQAYGGLLKQSLQYEVHDGYATVGSGVVYAAIHEYGGLPGMAPGPAAIPPRPYLHPAAEESYDEVVRVFGNTLVKELGP